MYTKCASKRVGDLNVKIQEMCVCSFNKLTWSCGLDCSCLQYGPIAECCKEGNKNSVDIPYENPHDFLLNQLHMG
jgi:hypothetical protein